MSSTRFVLRMAWRSLRATPRRLTLITAAIAAGVAALVAIESFTDNLRTSVREQAQALLGADLSLTSRRPFTPRVQALLDTLDCRAVACPGGRQAEVATLVNFGGMAYVPRTTGTRLVRVSAVQGPYPFYGTIVTDPEAAWSGLQTGRNVVVDPPLLAALGASVGDTLALGEARFRITGTITSIPGDVGIRSAFGPRIFIPAAYLDETELLTFGARAEYEAYVKLAAGVEPEPLAERYRSALSAERVRVRTVSEDRENLNDALARLASYLGLVGLIALLLGGIGVASAAYVLIRQEQESVAVLRCLGATSGQVFAVYLTQAVALALVGSFVGAAAGLVIQQILPGLLADFLPVTVSSALSFGAVAAGIGAGVLVALAFGAIPLLGVRRVPPLAVLRRDVEPSLHAGRDPARWIAFAVLVVTVIGLSVWQVGDWRRGLWFAGGVAAAILVLWAAAWALATAVRRWAPRQWPYVWRQGLANLHRPANQTVMVVLSIGFGAFLMGTLVLVQYNLLRQLRLTGGDERPNLVLFDIQTDQLAPIRETLRADGLPAVGPVPIVPMRILSVRGRPVAELLAASDTGEQSNSWVFRREYRSTYRDTIVASERVIAGSWWTAGGAVRRGGTNGAATPVAISVERDLAGELGVGIGDEIIWDVQGVPIESKVASLREVEWARFEPNFFVVFQSGALERAPQSHVMLTRAADPTVRGSLQRRLAERFSNVTTLDLTLLQAALEQLVDRVVLAIRFMALFTVATGAIVLVGAVATSRFQRLRESVLLKTLGATRRQVLRIAFAEYLALGSLSAATAMLLAAAAAWALARFVFESTFGVPLVELAALTAAVVLLTVTIGLANSREAVRKTPLEVLRGE